MPSRYYSSVAQDTTLTTNMTSLSNTAIVASVTGYPIPNYPFVIAIDYDTSNEELCLVTNSTGLTFNVTRGYNGSTAVAHNVGAVVRHVIVAQDLTDAQNHYDATSDVHGANGLVAGQGDVTAIAFLTMGA